MRPYFAISQTDSGKGQSIPHWVSDKYETKTEKKRDPGRLSRVSESLYNSVSRHRDKVKEIPRNLHHFFLSYSWNCRSLSVFLNGHVSRQGFKSRRHSPRRSLTHSLTRSQSLCSSLRRRLLFPCMSVRSRCTLLCRLDILRKRQRAG